MEAFIKDIFTFLLQYYALYFVIVMSIFTAVIMVILNFVKKPFKRLTSKISNEKVRKFTNNCVIISLSFALSFGLWFLLHRVAPHYFAIDYKTIFFNGAMPVVTYAFGEGWITADKAKQIISGTADKIADGTLTAEEAKETVSDLNSALSSKQNAEKELNKLLKK